MRHLLLTSTALILTACSGGNGQTVKKQTTIDLPTVDIRVTEAIDLPNAAVGVTFVPNRAPMSAWLGRIIVRTDDGALWQTNTNGMTPQRIADGTFDQAVGYVEGTGTPYLFALQGDTLQAFALREEAFERVSPLSTPTANITALCDGGTQSQLWALTNENTLVRFDVSEAGDGLALQEAADTSLKTKGVSCSLDSADRPVVQRADGTSVTYHDGQAKENPVPGYVMPLTSLSGSDTGLFVGTPKTGTAPLVFTDTTGRKIKITNGITISGTDTVGLLTGTRLPMGSVYDAGMLVAADANDNRLLLIALPYAERTLSEAAE